MKLDDDLITEVQNQLREADGQDIPFEQRRVKMEIRLSEKGASDKVKQWFAKRGGEISRQKNLVMYGSLPPDDVFSLRTDTAIDRVSLWAPKNGFPLIRLLFLFISVAVIVIVAVSILENGTQKIDVPKKPPPKPEILSPSDISKSDSSESVSGVDEDKKVISEEVLSKSEGYGEKMLEMGENLYDQGRYEEAIVAFTKASKLMPENGKVWLELAMALMHLERKTEALNMMKKAISKDPDNIAYLRHAAMTCMELGLNDQAKNYFRKILEKNPNDPDAKAGLKMIGNDSQQ